MSVHFCCLYTNRCTMGAPLAQEKSLVGIDRHSGKHVTHCTRIVFPCLETCNIAVYTRVCTNIPHCSVCVWLLLKETQGTQHTSDSWKLAHIQHPYPQEQATCIPDLSTC